MSRRQKKGLGIPSAAVPPFLVESVVRKVLADGGDAKPFAMVVKMNFSRTSYTRTAARAPTHTQKITRARAPFGLARLLII